MATLLEQETEVFRFMRDTSKTFVTSADVRAWLNRGAREIAERTRVMEKDSAPAAGATVALPTDYYDLVALVVGTETIPVTFVDDDYYLENKNGSWSPIEGTIARMKSPDTVEIYPTPTVAYALRYVYLPADRTTDGAESDLPPEYDDVMVDYAVAHGLYKERDTELGDFFLSRFEESLPARSHVGRKFPGVLNIRYQDGPLDEVGTHRG